MNINNNLPLNLLKYLGSKRLAIFLFHGVIKKNYFDIVVYGSIRRSTLFLEEATSSNSKIIFIIT